MRHFAVFGSHPRLSLAEFRAVRPNLPSPLLIGSAALFEDAGWDGDALMRLLGGTVKLGDVIATIPTDTLDGEKVAETIPLLTKEGAGGGLDFGLTVFGGKRFSKLPIEFKRALKSRGVASRWVTGKDGGEIAPAAIAKLKLTTEGLDLCVFVDGGDAHIGVTTHVQDADAWSMRDYGRPARDELAGMLPPKLARMMVNLSAMSHGTILDPFCGSGTILMEAALATDAERIIGSDIEKKQISDTQKNIAWLIQNRILTGDDGRRIETLVADARKLSPHVKPSSVDAVVTEGMLGPPLRGSESRAALEKNAKEISDLWVATLRELKPLLAPRARLVCVWPAFKTTGGMARVDLESNLPDLGYELVDPFAGWDVAPGPLLYHRVGQKVMRRIAVIKPK